MNVWQLVFLQTLEATPVQKAITLSLHRISYFARGKEVLFSLFSPFSLCLGANPNSASEAQITPFALQLYFGSTGQDNRLWGYVSVQTSVPVMANSGNQAKDQLLASSLPSVDTEWHQEQDALLTYPPRQDESLSKAWFFSFMKSGVPCCLDILYC